MFFRVLCSSAFSCFFARRITESPLVKFAEQVTVQVIPAGLLVTIPLPVPAAVAMAMTLTVSFGV
jgi:hypothetical protein